MATRKPRPAIELASDIGAKAMDLYAHGDEATDDAFLFMWQANPDVFQWLAERLEAVRRIRGSR